MVRRALALVTAVVVASSSTRAASAAPALGPEGTRIGTNAYRIDLFQGPVLSSSRVTGLAGAYAPIAEGVEGHAVNAASPAVREQWSRSWFDYDLGIGVTFPNALARNDFDNDGRTGFRYSNFLFATLGANVQLGRWGFGASIHGQTYQLGPRDDSGGPSLELAIARTDVLLAHAFLDGQLVIGAGLRSASLGLQESGGGRTFFSTASAGPQIGALVAPSGLPLRVAVTARGAMKPDAASAAKDVQRDGADQAYVDGRTRWYVPTEVVLPWEIEAGFAWQLGERPLNLPWIDPRRPPPEYLDDAKTETGEIVRVRNAQSIDRKLRARYDALPRRKLLLVASVLVSGPVADAVGVESFLVQYVQRSGTRPTVTPRLGVEAEPLADVLQIRAGSYLEPSRFSGASPRLHGTLGADVRLIRWDVFGLLDEGTTWRVGGFADVSRAYFGWGLTFGLWH